MNITYSYTIVGVSCVVNKSQCYLYHRHSEEKSMFTARFKVRTPARTLTMASQLKRLKQIDDRTKYLIFGYNKEIKQTLASYNLFQSIPFLIDSLCILYYLEMDKFKVCDPKYVTILNGGRTVRLSSQRGATTGGEFALGNIIMSSTKSLNCKWRLKVDKVGDGKMFIGIAHMNQLNAKQYDSCRYYNYYIYGCPGEGITNAVKWWYEDEKDTAMLHAPYGELLDTNDIIEVSLIINETKQILSFTRNGENLGIAFDHIQVGEDIHYRLVAMMQDLNDQWTIIDFKTK